MKTQHCRLDFLVEDNKLGKDIMENAVLVVKNNIKTEQINIVEDIVVSGELMEIVKSEEDVFEDYRSTEISEELYSNYSLEQTDNPELIPIKSNLIEEIETDSYDSNQLERNKERKSKHQCQFCDYTASRKAYIKIHIDGVHKNLKEYRCHLCLHATSTKYNLKNHIKSVHMNLKEHKCHLCDYAANRISNLRIHINDIHMNLNKLKCSLCDHATKNHYFLKKHMKEVHKMFQRDGRLECKSRDYQCHLCDYAATLKDYLKRHIRDVHINSKDHKCHLCSYAASRKGSLKRHINNVHGNSK